MGTQCTAVSSTDSQLHAPPARFKQTESGDQVNAATFERFLCWLSPDPETASLKYESIRTHLIKMFKARRCVLAEDLADATFERVARKLNTLADTYTGDPAPYFYGVARKIHLEYQRQLVRHHRRVRSSLPINTEDPDLEHLFKQLDEALSTIPESDRELILSYYTGTGQNQINHRRALAQRFGLGPNALRLRVFRIRKEIKNYLLRFDTDALFIKDR